MANLHTTSWVAQISFVDTSAIAFRYCNMIKLVPYLWLGQINFESLKISIYMMASASLAVFAGV
jgi:hypothetical protein